MNYASYLQLNQLLSLQQPASPSDEHRNENLFIITHQTYELWFKQLIDELHLAIALIEEGNIPAAIETMTRVNAITQTVVNQIAVICTLKFHEFQRFRSYLGSATLDANLNWHRGTGAFGAKPAPEEATHSGSARVGIAMGDISLNQPFALGQQPWRYYTSLRGQWSANALTPQERLAIGGRYTVCGFDGEMSLSGERGMVWRNELAWNVQSRGHELYTALDYGRVGGPSARSLVGKQLTGAALGVRGALWRRFSYDLFAGVPLSKPDAFHTSGATAGFSVNLEI